MRRKKKGGVQQNESIPLASYVSEIRKEVTPFFGALRGGMNVCTTVTA